MPSQQSFDPDVLVEIGPLDRVSVAERLPILSLGGRSVQQARIPSQRYDETASVGEINDQVIFSCHDLSRLGLNFKNQSSHTISHKAAFAI